MSPVLTILMHAKKLEWTVFGYHGARLQVCHSMPDMADPNDKFGKYNLPPIMPVCIGCCKDTGERMRVQKEEKHTIVIVNLLWGENDALTQQK